MAVRTSAEAALLRLNARIASCEQCSRLRDYCREVARVRRRAFRDETYWGRPVPSFGDPRARLLIVGLAPAAHGGNRTGRVFTGDSSGDWLYAALHRSGFASQPTSVSIGDGLEVRDAWITAVAHCAPPGNKPTLEEQAACRPYLVEELQRLDRVRVIVALGKIGFDGLFRALGDMGLTPPRPRPVFGHGAEVRLDVGRPVRLISSFHPSRQNTNTGKLTREMFDRPFSRAREILDSARD